MKKWRKRINFDECSWKIMKLSTLTEKFSLNGSNEKICLYFVSFALTDPEPIKWVKPTNLHWKVNCVEKIGSIKKGKQFFSSQRIHMDFRVCHDSMKSFVCICWNGQIFCSPKIQRKMFTLSNFHAIFGFKIGCYTWW